MAVESRGSGGEVRRTDTPRLPPTQRQHQHGTSAAAPAAQMSRAPLDSDPFPPPSQSPTLPDRHGPVNPSSARNGATSFPTPASPSAFPIHGRLAWLVCASIAVLSARHLLVERNLHYPLQLYFAQLAVSALFALRPFWSRKDAQASFRERPEARASATRGVVLLLTAMCLGSLSTVCALQAILHVTNLPTLILMTVSIWLALV
jgi:hypothetical protein